MVCLDQYLIRQQSVWGGERQTGKAGLCRCFAGIVENSVGCFGRESPMSTREDVARMAGVSGATVSYVLNNTKRVTPQVRERVLEAANTLGYRPNLVARSLVMKQTMHVALLVDNLMNPYYGQLAEGVQSVASRYGYLVSSLAVNVSNRASLLELTSRGVDGILFAVGSHDDMKECVGDHLSVPCLWGSEAPSYRNAIFHMVHCLKEKGHEKIAFLSGMPVEKTNHYRYRFFVEALKQEGLPVCQALVVDGRQNGNTDEQAGIEATKELLRRKEVFTAIFAVNDLMALGCYRQLRLEGYQVPRDVSLVGCDGIPFLENMYPALATLDMKGFEVGQHMMYSLLEKIQPKWEGLARKDQIEGEFLERESVAEAPRYGSFRSR